MSRQDTAIFKAALQFFVSCNLCNLILVRERLTFRTTKNELRMLLCMGYDDAYDTIPFAEEVLVIIDV